MKRIGLIVILGLVTACESDESYTPEEWEKKMEMENQEYLRLQEERDKANQNYNGAYSTQSQNDSSYGTTTNEFPTLEETAREIRNRQEEDPFDNASHGASKDYH